jgi:hypothetical protein
MGIHLAFALCPLPLGLDFAYSILYLHSRRQLVLRDCVVGDIKPVVAVTSVMMCIRLYW